MRSSIKKIAAVLLTTALLASGCGRTSSSTSVTSDKPIELTFLHMHGGAGGELVNQLCKEYEQVTGGKVRVTPIFVEGSYEGALEKLQTMAVSKTLPNITQAGHQYVNFMTENFPVVYAQNFIDKDKTDTSDFFPKMLDLGRDKQGKLAGIPFAISTSVLYLNKNMFLANGLDPANPPKTFDELREVAKKLTHDGNYGLYINYDITGNWEIQTMVEDMGGKMFSNDGKSVAFEKEGLETLRYLNALVNEDKSMPLMNNNQATEAFKAGKIGMYITTIAGLRGFQKDNTKFEVVTALHPTDNAGHKGAPAGGNSLYVLKSTPEKEQAAWEFIKYLTSAENTAKVAQTFGYMVSRQSALASEKLMGKYLKDNPSAAITYEQVSWMTPWANFPGSGGTKYVKITQDGITAVLNQQKTPEEAIKTIINDSNALIK